MECDSENVTETEKYAFLLGSALRNDDTEQFISVYDSIIPHNLPDSQLDSIKDKARVISELPDAGFNDLVSRARTFSLAPAGSMTSTHARWSSDDDDEGVSSIGERAHMPGTKSDTSSLYSAARRSESDTRRCDDDSGLCNSSKATNSVGSLSDDHDGSDSENRRHFDYFPSHPQVKIRSGGGLLLDYDEVHSVHSDNSSDDIISPRSDISEKTFENGIEMQPLRRRSVDVADDFSFQRETYQQQDDFNTDDDSDDESRSYRSPYTRNTGYVPMQRDPTNVYKPKFDASRSQWETSSSLRHRSVDDSIDFSSRLKEGTSPYSRYTSYQSVGSTASSEKVKIEKNSYKNEPPFGRGVDQLHKVAHSIRPLISGYPGDQAVENLPPARKLEVLTSEDTKKRKKRRKGNKDEPQTDENGNPVEGLGLTPSSYRQMRESPSPVLGGPTSKNRHTSEFSTNQYGTFPSFDSYPSHTNPELEDGSSKSQDRHSKLRKKREEKKEEVKRSEDIQDYVGDKKSIDELLQFIDGNHAGVKKSKKLVSKTTEDIPTKANKTKHKNKDKKQKSPTPSNSIEEIEKGDNSAQIASLELESGVNNMGNTGGKTECENPVENGDSVSVETEALSTCNDLLKQDDKINNKSDKNDKKSKSVSNSIISSQTNVIKGDITLDKCEKLKNKESVKSGIKKDTPASVTSEKKKAEKPQTKGNNKMERSELTTSKSDDSLVRADTSASMSVKQKNAKNKKSKPQSLQAAKDESNARSIEGSHKAIDIPAISNEGLIDNNFIFTDLDVPLVPKEDEFRIVSKKKKKITKEIQPNHYFNNGSNNNKSFTRFYDDKRSIAPSNGNNKLPQSNIIPTTIESDNRVRDLSPSAFPALCSSERERQSLKDGRRNSTGDVPIPSEVLLKSQDDSDMESVKSLPATQGSRAADTLLSPRLNVSYARMAACPKPDDGYLSPGEKSPEIDTTDNIDRKVWKGSPTERRHSIGSSPEGNVIISTTNSPALKIGSSEAFIVEPIESKSDSTVYMAKGHNVHCVQQSKSDEVILGKKEVNLTKENYKIAKQCAIVIPTVQQKSPNSLQDTYYNSNIKNIKHERGTKIPENIEPNLNSINNDTFCKQYHISNVNSKQYIQKSVSKPNSSSISSKKVKQQSVIFLDRRLAEAPENLGITFGFEFEPLMNTVASDKKQEKMDSSVISSVSGEITNLFEDSNVTFLSDDNENKPIDKDADINSSSSSSVICKTPEVSEPVTSLTDDKNNPDFLQKVQSQLGRLNGVLPPPSQGQVKAVTGENPLEDPAIVEVHPPLAPMEKAVENMDADSSDVDVKCSPYNSNGVIVYFGESVATLKKDVVVPSATNGPTRYCGKVTHIPEAGEPNGNFNHADVVTFLNAEWEKIQKLEKREPAAVKVHGMS